MGFIPDPKYMRYKGFEVADTAAPYFELLCLPFDKNVDKPHFSEVVKGYNAADKDFTLYYTSQCPFTAKYVPLLEGKAKGRNISFKMVHIQTREEAKNTPTPFTTFSHFYKGKFITHEILSEKKFEKILESKGL